MNRADAVQAIMSNGKTEEQANAFLDLLGSAFARRRWIEGKPLTPEEIEERFNTFVDAGRVPEAGGSDG